MHLSTTTMARRVARVVRTGLMAALIIPVVAFAQSPAKVDLLSAGNFEILASTTITSTGLTIINGDIALSPGSSVTGFPPGIVNGTKHITDAIAALAQTDLTTAYNDAAGRSLNVITKSGNIGGQTLAPGLYKSTSSLAISSGDLTLDAQGDANAVWIFQIASTLTTTAGRQVVLAGGAQAKNIFWQVGTSATLGTGSIFYGNILANISITLTSSTQMVGRSLARTGAVTCGASGSTHPDSVKANTPIFSPVFNTASHVIDLTPARVDSTSWTLFTIANTGTADLIITSATTSSTVFASHLSGTTIAPGKSITDSIRYHPTKPGADSGLLFFTHNGASSPDTIKVRSSSARSAMLSTASRNIIATPAHVDSTSWTLITLTNTGNDTLRFSGATSTNGVFTSHLSAMVIAPGASIIDSIRFHPTAMGDDSTKLIFVSNGTTSPDTISVRATGRQAIFTTVSRSVNCGTTPVGTPTMTIITIRNTGNDTLRIASVSSTNAVYTSHLSGTVVAPGSTVVDTVKFLPTAVGPASGQLSFVSNAATSPDMILVYGNAIAVSTGALLSTAFRYVDCGNAEVNTHTWTVITLYNLGTDTLRVASAASTNAVFTSHLSATVIPPQGQFLDSIRFQPTATGGFNGALLFISNALTSPDTIRVYGYGTPRSSVASLGSPAGFVLARVYPNPVHDMTQLDIVVQDGERLTNAALYDMRGLEIQNWTSRVVSGGTLSLHLGGVPAGEYIVRIRTTARSQSLPVVIVK